MGGSDGTDSAPTESGRVAECQAGRTLLPLVRIYPALAMRLPDTRALSEKLDKGISAILGGQPAQASLAAVAASWDASRAGRPEALKEVRANVGLT